MPSVPGVPPTRSKAPLSTAIGTLVPSAEEYEAPPKDQTFVDALSSGGDD
jgi:hypothetical protein